MNIIQLTSISGTSPYDIYVCDITNTYCYLVSGSTVLPPLISFVVPSPLESVTKLLLKLIDSNGCSKFYYYECTEYPVKQFQDLEIFQFMDGEVYQFE